MEYLQTIRGDGDYFCEGEGVCQECLESGYQPVYYCEGCEYMHFVPCEDD